jgi:hypothetical protein
MVILWILAVILPSRNGRFEVLEDLTPATLTRRAMDFANAALEGNKPGKEHLVALHAGAAVEFMAKATLSASNPVLLLELGNTKQDSLLHLAGVRKSDQLRTVGLTAAIERVKVVHTEIKIDKTEFAALVSARDGATHLGQRDGDVHAILVTFARLIDQMLRVLDQPRHDFWSVHLELVDSLITERMDRVKTDVLRRIAIARQRFEELHSGRELELLETVNRTVIGAEAPDAETVQCPACRQKAVLQGEYEIDVEGDEDGAHDFIVFYANGLRCLLCGLSLVNVDQVAAAGIETVQAISPDREDYQDMYEYLTYPDDD